MRLGEYLVFFFMLSLFFSFSLFLSSVLLIKSSTKLATLTMRTWGYADLYFSMRDWWVSFLVTLFREVVVELVYCPIQRFL